MRIGIDIRPLIFTRAGIHTYVRQLVEHLSAVPGNQLFLFTSAASGVARDARTVKEVNLRLPQVHPWCERFWQSILLPPAARRERLAVFHGTRFWVPHGAGCPSVVTVHDLAFKKLSGLVEKKTAVFFDRLVRQSLRRADRVIVPSETSKADLIQLYAARPQQIEVVYEAAEKLFAPREKKTAQEECRRRFGITRPFFLFAGTLEPRKNLVRLLEAYGLIHDHSETDLVIAGGKGWQYQDMFAAVRRLGLESRVRFIGYVQPQELCALYNACEVFVFPSIYEGFGLPVLEAIACGAVAVTAANSALRELFGECTCQVDAGSAESIADGLRRAAADTGLRRALREKGLRRAGEFSWEKTAARTLEVYRQVIGDVPILP
ncbi:MAG TPA: glycosyltransferase family 1 protein [Candidatus Omnitrophota bacterium]|nr:glycosyltransferase family 1 protein [Candidatus Omnitrophota bacterium]HRZ14500.1 glycosyltransferase family 1 protein [Candidatus Omnitrophota bacterium]